MVSPEYEVKLKEVSKAISERVQAERAKAVLMQRPAEVLDTQIEAWKNSPKEQALKEAIALMRNKGMEPAEKRIELEVLKFVSEIQGAFVPQQNTGNNIVAIKFIMPETTPLKPIIDVTNEAKAITISH